MLEAWGSQKQVFCVRQAAKPRKATRSEAVTNVQDFVVNSECMLKALGSERQALCVRLLANQKHRYL